MLCFKAKISPTLFTKQGIFYAKKYAYPLVLDDESLIHTNLSYRVGGDNI